MILAPAAMQAEKDPKVSAQKCFDGCGLDPDNYRIGHTKASKIEMIFCR
jgi:myosin heavy chain 6/7